MKQTNLKIQCKISLITAEQTHTEWVIQNEEDKVKNIYII